MEWQEKEASVIRKYMKHCHFKIMLAIVVASLKNYEIDELRFSKPNWKKYVI